MSQDVVLFDCPQVFYYLRCLTYPNNMYVQAHLLYWLTTPPRFCYHVPLGKLYIDHLSESFLRTPW